MPKAEERLLAVVHALLHRCYKMPFSNNAEVPAALKKELSGGNLFLCNLISCGPSTSANKDIHEVTAH